VWAVAVVKHRHLHNILIFSIFEYVNGKACSNLMMHVFTCIENSINLFVKI